MKLLITGCPKSGKSTLAKRINHPGTYHTDDTIDLGWSEASLEVSTWFDRYDSFCIEGVSVPRALRKWLARNPQGKPCDQIIYLKHPRETLSSGQITMNKGIEKVWGEILPHLQKRGVLISYNEEREEQL